MIRIVVIAMVFVTVLAQAQDASKTSTSADTPKVDSRPALAPNTDSRRLVFTLDELDHGRKLNTRTLEMLCREREYSTLKAGSRVPIMTTIATMKNGAPESAPAVQYVDVGLNVRVHYVLRADGKLNIWIDFDMSNVAPPEPNTPHTDSLTPVIRQARSEVAAVVTPDTPTVLDTIEDLGSGHTYQLSLTVKDR